MGGYAHDQVGYPVCTEGRQSCLWTKVMAQPPVFTRAQYNAAALKWVLNAKEGTELCSLLVHIAEFYS